MWVGNSYSMLVHAEDCEYAESILEREDFCELYQALSAGYMEAGCCLTDRPYHQLRTAHEVRKVHRARLVSPGCMICGESRVVEMAHVYPRALGGTKRIPLCPTHHAAFDEGLLSDKELRKLPDVARHNHGAVRAMRDAVRKVAA